MVLLAVATGLLKPLIPGPPPNVIATFPGDFLKQAASERIDWRPIDTEAFSEARRLDRPVILLVGVAWSRNGRAFESDVLSDAGVQNYLSRNFICVRIDGAEMPAWLTAYLPLNRVSLGIRPRFQIWVLEPDGKLVHTIGPRRPETHFDQNNFLEELVRVRKLYTQLRQQDATSPYEVAQQQDISQIEANGTSASVNFDMVLSQVSVAADRRNGGFPAFGYQDLHPSTWAYLAETGHRDLLHDTLAPVLRSPVVDVVDGGFFSAAYSLDWKNVEFDKHALQNAEMASMLSKARLSLPSEDRAVAEYILRGTIGSLTTEFADPSGLIQTARIGDEEEDGRSPHTSVSPRRLRDTLDPEDRDPARDALGLRVETNPQMAPMLAKGAPDPEIRRIIARLKATAPLARFSTGFFMDVNGTVAARLMETGRAIGDASLIDFGSRLFAAIDTFRVGDQVPHDLEVSARSPATLLDFLGYADAGMQDYVTSGRVVSLRNGLAVLQRGLATFSGANPGEYKIGLPPSSKLIPDESVTPQIVDDVGESGSAKVLRLCTEYGRVLLGDGSDSGPGLILLRTAYATDSLLGDTVGPLGVSGAGFACASASLTDDLYAITVGPQAQALSDQLFALRPTRFIAPAFGPVRPDLKGRAPGIYLFRLGRPTGPLTVAQALQTFPLALDVGR